MPLIDMGNAEDFVILPKGTYPFTLDAWEWVDAEDVGDGDGDYGMLKLTFKYDGEESEYQNAKQFVNHSESPKSLKYMKRTLIALGAEDGDLSGSFDLDEIMPDLLHNPCQLVIDIGDYNGEPKNDVKRVVKESAVAA